MTDQEFRNDHLKLCFLWYDEVILETIGVYDERRFVERLLQSEGEVRGIAHSMTDVIRPLDKRLQESIQGDVVAQARKGYPRWGEDYENYTYPEPENAEQYAHNYLLELIAKEHGVARFDDGYDIEQAEGRARNAVDAVTLWEGVNAELPCMLQASQDEKAAVIATRKFASVPEANEQPFELFEATIPSFREVPWSEVVQFRKNGSLKTLREKIAQSVEESGSNLELAKTLFHEAENVAIDTIIQYGRPKVWKVAIEAIIGNLPGMAVNPFSLYFGSRDTLNAAKRARDVGWFYLLRDMRSTTKCENM